MNPKTEELIKSYSKRSREEGFEPKLTDGIFEYKFKSEIYRVNLELADKLIDKAERAKLYCKNLKVGDTITYIHFNGGFGYKATGKIRENLFDAYLVGTDVVNINEIVFENETIELIMAKAKIAFILNEELKSRRDYEKV